MSLSSFSLAANAIADLKLRGPNRDVAAYWLTQWHGDTPPTRARFAQRRGWTHNPAISYFEVRKNLSVRCIAAGVYFELALGFNLVDKDVLALVPDADRKIRLSRTWAVGEGGVMAANRQFGSNRTACSAQEVYLPFSDRPGDDVRYYMMHSNWRPVGGEWVTGTAQTNTSLAHDPNGLPFTERLAQSGL